VSAPAWLGLAVAIGEGAIRLADLALDVAEKHGGPLGRDASQAARARAQARRARAEALRRAEADDVYSEADEEAAKLRGGW
jgi:hypothetical protein